MPAVSDSSPLSGVGERHPQVWHWEQCRCLSLGKVVEVAEPGTQGQGKTHLHAKQEHSCLPGAGCHLHEMGSGCCQPCVPASQDRRHLGSPRTSA